MKNTAPRLDPLFEDEIILPVQYADMVRGDARRPPEHRLLFAVLEDAVRCWQLYETATTRRGRNLFWETAAWFASDADDSPFAFIAICQLFGLEPGYVRTGLQRWSQRHRASGNTNVVPFRVRRVGGMRHSVTGVGLGLRPRVPSRRHAPIVRQHGAQPA
jgi:hypothetical protein